MVLINSVNVGFSVLPAKDLFCRLQQTSSITEIDTVLSVMEKKVDVATADNQTLREMYKLLGNGMDIERALQLEQGGPGNDQEELWKIVYGELRRRGCLSPIQGYQGSITWCE